MNPAVVVVSEINVNTNSPFFLTRFRELVELGITMFTCNDELLDLGGCNGAVLSNELSLVSRQKNGWPISKRHVSLMGRQVFERLMDNEMIDPGVACEGSNRVARHERFDKWQERMWKVGFVNRPYTRAAVSNMSRIAKQRGPFNVVLNEGGGIEMLYRNHSLEYCCAWTTAQHFSNSNT